MTSGPTFEQPGALPARGEDMLDVVAGIDREMNRLAAARALALDLAHKAHVERTAPPRAGASLGDDSAHNGVRFGHTVLAERSFRAEVALLLNISERAAENLIGMSRALVTSMPQTMKALSDGDISWRHATIMIDETSSMTREDQERIEHLVLSGPDRLTPPKFARAIRKAREELNPETIVVRHALALDQRGVSIEDGRDGISTLYVPMPSVQAHAIFNRLTTAARALDDPLDDRTLDNRRADILAHVLLATVDGEVFGVVPDEWDDHKFVHWYRGITAQVQVTVPVLTLLGESETPATLDGVIPIDPITARILAADAPSFVRLLTHPETGAVLSVGRKRYKVPKDLRRHLVVRDLTCRFPGCSMPAERCEMDHVFDWQYGGETKAVNLAHLCPGHHTLKGNTEWTVTESEDGSGVLTWTSPTGRTYRTFPHNPLAA